MGLKAHYKRRRIFAKARPSTILTFDGQRWSPFIGQIRLWRTYLEILKWTILLEIRQASANVCHKSNTWLRLWHSYFPGLGFLSMHISVSSWSDRQWSVHCPWVCMLVVFVRHERLPWATDLYLITVEKQILRASSREPHCILSD